MFSLIVVIFAVFAPSVGFSKPEVINPLTFASDSKPYGLTMLEWSEKWWNWFVGIPQSDNPGSDPTGMKCAVHQDDAKIWYLTGANSGTVERKCTIPAGKGIAFSVAGNECSYAENPSLKTEQQLRECAVTGDQVSSLQVHIDGNKLENLDKYVVVTPPFQLILPVNNIFGAPPGTTQAVSHSYFIFLKPLSPGIHTIHFSVVYLGNPETGAGANSYDVKYTLNVSKS